MNIDHKQAKRHGYLVCITDSSKTIIPNALHIEVNGENPKFKSDYEAAKRAEKDGIPIIHDIPGCEDWTYVDTPENRALILSTLARYPRFDCRTWNTPLSEELAWTTENLIACDLSVSEGAEYVEATFECYFDWGAKFGINFDKIEEDANDMAWLNLYANYHPRTGELQMFYTVDDNCKNENFDYTPSEKDRIAVIASMEIACRKEADCSMAELVAQHVENTTPGKNLCAATFVRNTTQPVVSVLMEISPETHNDLGDDFLMNVTERQDAYGIAAKAIGDDTIAECVIFCAYVFRNTEYWLAEASDNSFFELSSFNTLEAAHTAMCKRVADVRDVAYNKIVQSYLDGEEFDDDTSVLDRSAFTKRFDSPYDWAIFELPPIPGSKFTDKDTRSLLLSIFDRDIEEPEIFDTEEEARELMFERVGDAICVSAAVIRERYENCDWDQYVKADEYSASVERFGHHSWSIIVLDDI